MSRTMARLVAALLAMALVAAGTIAVVVLAGRTPRAPATDA